MSLFAAVCDERWRKTLICTPAHTLLHGSVNTQELADHWYRPLRFFSGQEHALGSCQAWHPGLYRQMARTTAGVCVECVTDASELALEVSPYPISAAVQTYMADVAAVSRAWFDGIACEVDGQVLTPSWGQPVPEALQLSEMGTDEDDVELPQVPNNHLLCVSLDDPAYVPGEGVVSLPGLGAEHHVRLWLPCFHEVAIRNLWSDGTYVTPVAARSRLLVLGDGLAQGLAVGNPARTWPAQLAQRLGLDLLNQGVVSQVFQPGMLAELGRLEDVVAIVMSYGATYRHERCTTRQLAWDLHVFFTEFMRLQPQTPLWLISPLWVDSERVQTHEASCVDRLPELLKECAAAYDTITYVEGEAQVEHRSQTYADGRELLSEWGSRVFAERLEAVIRAS